ncbi:MAG: DUF3343 domain-containing protein [Firmicutes bacterium]|nr:DUF3343 domain-containing protein [Bacillota bacterium]
MYYIFAFRSRTGAMRFFEALNRERIVASLINTPKGIGIGCGLSVKVFDLSAGKRVISGGYGSFHGVYMAESSNNVVRYTRV